MTTTLLVTGLALVTSLGSFNTSTLNVGPASTVNPVVTQSSLYVGNTSSFDVRNATVL